MKIPRLTEPVLLICVFLISSEMLAIRSLVYESKCKEMYSNCSFLRQSSMMDAESVQKRNLIQRNSSQSLAIYTLLTFLFPLFASLYFGAAIDNGRYKSALILPMSTYALGMGCLAVCISLKLDVRYFYLAAFIKAILGGEQVFFMVSFTYIVKTSTPQSLALKSIVAEILCTLGYISGSILTGIMADNGLYFKIIIIILSLSVFCIIYSAILIPNVPQSENPSILSQIKSYGGIFKDNIKLIIIYFFINGAVFVPFISFFICNYLFVSGNPFLMNNFYYSLLTLTIGLTGSAFGLVGGFSIHKGLIGLKKASLVALILNSLGLFLFGAAQSYLAIFLGSVFVSWYIVVLANFKTILSQLVHKDKNGRLFTCIFLLENFLCLIFQPLSLVIYGSSVTIHPGLLFFILASLLILVAIAFIAIIAHQSKKANQ